MTVERARLLVECPDRTGLVAAVAGFLAEHGANIVESDQHSSEDRFYLRMVLEVPDLDRRLEELRDAFAERVAGPLGMRWRIVPASTRRRVAILVSREGHCLTDLLWRWERGELECDLRVVVSNHETLRGPVEAAGVRFLHNPATPDTRAAAEARLLDELRGEVDLVVLARYMQILTGPFIAEVGAPIINIHHSFLPAFVGAGPYRQAHDRGVKVIGATAHYVTEQLDAGPIIDQDVAHVNHRASVQDLVRVGADVERLVLARAVRSHLADRVLVDGHRTIVF